MRLTVCVFSLLCSTLAWSADLPDPSHLPENPNLPDPFTFFNGLRVETRDDWYEKRRPELKQLFQEYVYGYLPESKGIKVRRRQAITYALDGKATLIQAELKLKGLSRKAPRIHVALFVPNKTTTPTPVFVGINKCGNHTVLNDPNIRVHDDIVQVHCEGTIEEQRGNRTDYWCVEYLIDRGYAFATFYVGDLDPDRDDFSDGIHPWVDNPPNDNPDANWGTIAAWAWGFHRVVDFLETEPLVNPEKIAVIGHSRRGKTALFAAAMDERIALAVPHQSGTGGMALSRDNDQETIERINRVFPHWFNDNFAKFNDTEYKLPIDQHLLVALVAPRALLDNGGLQDTWANFLSAYQNLQAASAVYEFLGVDGMKGTGLIQGEDAITSENTGRLLQYRRDEKHTLNKGYWRAILDFADIHLK